MDDYYVQFIDIPCTYNILLYISCSFSFPFKLAT